MATLSCILAWRIPWTEKPNRLQSMGLKESNKTEQLNTHTHTRVHAQSLCGPLDCSPPGSSVHGIFHVRILEWIAFSSSRESSQLRD